MARGGRYRGDDDDEEADGDKAKVGDQPIVEQSEVAEGGHLLPIRVDQRGPAEKLELLRSNQEEPHIVRSMNMQMETLTTGTSWGT